MASIIVLGALAASAIEVPLAAGATLMGVFALFHGYAHGAEAPAGAGVGFPLGFALSTAALHGLGVVAGVAALKLQRPLLLRLIGGGIALGGMVLIVAG
jgi:urease accessory protein